MFTVIRVLALLACTAVCALAQAQVYPAKPVRIVVSYSAGGATDVFARAIGQQLSEGWGQQVLVENKPGANSIIATEYVAKSAPDGYTLLVFDPALMNNAALYSKLPYDPVRDITPITQLVAFHQIFVVNSGLPVRNIRELIELAKTKPRGLSYASIGIGSTVHLVMEMFQSMAGIKMNHVPYKGGAAAVADVVAGRVHVSYGTFSLWLPRAKEGKVTALAVDSAKRLPRYPDLPTVAETLPGFESISWFGLGAPAGTPRDAVVRLVADIRKMLADPVFRDKILDPNGYEPVGSSPEQFSEFIRSEALKWGRVARDAHIKLD